jgi:hypothetical protein
MIRFSFGGQLNPKNAPEVELEDGRSRQDSLLPSLAESRPVQAIVATLIRLAASPLIVRFAAGSTPTSRAFCLNVHP